jgi:poly(A) polymerase
VTISPVPVRLPDPPWLTATPTRRVLAALMAGGTEVRFVGGCVRDALIGHAVSDIDIATPDAPEVAMRKIVAAGLRALPTGIAHGTVTALCDARRFEVTTLRRDVETDGRHARVAFTDDWRADAARRDFTMNAMSAGADGVVHDYFGGLADLRDGRVRFVGDPAARIAEDHLRLLRFWRFHAHYGRGAPADAERAACRAAAPLLVRLSGERVRAELLKLLAAPDPVPSVAAMAEDGVLASLGAGPLDVGALAALVTLEPEAGRDALRRLAVLLPRDAGPDAVVAVARRLRLSRAEGERLAACAGAGTALPADRGALRAALHHDGAEALRDRVLVAAARARHAPGDIAAALDEIAAWSPRALPVSGADVLALGGVPGPGVGRLLGAVEAWWVAADFAPDREACRAQLRRLMAMSPPAGGS